MNSLSQFPNGITSAFSKLADLMDLVIMAGLYSMVNNTSASPEYQILSLPQGLKVWELTHVPV